MRLAITPHGLRRAMDPNRTLATPPHILLLVSSQAAVPLGCSGHCDFHLLYSIADTDYRIALTQEGGTVLHSVWHWWWNLPETVSRPTDKMMREAKRRCIAWFDERFTAAAS